MLKGKITKAMVEMCITAANRKVFGVPTIRFCTLHDDGLRDYVRAILKESQRPQKRRRKP